MKQWLPSQPLILTPIIPLMWTTGWACMASAYTVLEIQPPYSAQLQESILLISSGSSDVALLGLWCRSAAAALI